MILVYQERWSYGNFPDDNNIYYKMKNDLTTGTWQDDIWCPIFIILFCTSDVGSLLVLIWSTCLPIKLEVLQWVLNVTLQHALLLSKLEVLKTLSYGCSVTYFCCRYLMTQNVPSPPLVDQIFTHKIRQWSQNSSKNQWQKKDYLEWFFNTESFVKI